MFYIKDATGKMSFTPSMLASSSNLNQKLKGLVVDIEEHMGGSDEANEGGSVDEVQCISTAESRSPSRSVHSS